MFQTVLLKKREAENHVLPFDSYRRLKLFLIVHLLVWSSLIIVISFFWLDLNAYLRWTLFTVGALFIPDYKSFAFIFQNYDNYMRAKQQKAEIIAIEKKGAAKIKSR